MNVTQLDAMLPLVRPFQGPEPAPYGTVLYIRGVEPFTKGTPNNWTANGIAEVANYRQPFALTDHTISTAQFVIVICPTTTHAELNTPEFWAAWKQFAGTGMIVKVDINSTQKACNPEKSWASETKFAVQHTIVGDIRDGIVPFAEVVFFTEDFMRAVGAKEFYRRVLTGYLRLDYDDNLDLERLTLDPEIVFGQYDNIWIPRNGKPRGSDTAVRHDVFGQLCVVRFRADGATSGLQIDVEDVYKRAARHERQLGT